MGLLSIFKRSVKPADPPDPAQTPDAVAQARSRARRRLLGASLLLAAGVIGFPLLFETQPRPISVDIPIEMPHRDKAPPLVLTPAPAAAPVDAPPARPLPSPPPEVAERAADQGRELSPPTATPAASPPNRQIEARPPTVAAANDAGASAPAPRAEAARPAAAAKPVPAPSKPAASTDAARAQALLDGKPASAADDTRLVVQVGAYTDPEKLRQVRAKLEQMGYKTYTQVVEVGGERRTRVRVGPLANRADADKAAARIKAAGLQAAILSL